MEKTYKDFQSAKDLREFYQLNESEESSIESDEKKHITVNDDKFEVKYADLKGVNNIFKNIVIFTNDKSPKGNKTLNQIMSAIKNIKGEKPKLHIFIAEEVMFEEKNGNILNIYDSDYKFAFTNESNIDTLIFSRLGVQGEGNCEHVVSMLQDRGFLVLNPVRFSALASNKYESAVLFEKSNIPQPNFCLMTKDILYDEKLFFNNMKRVNKNWSKDSDKNEEISVVVKILDGHGGTGVFLIDGKRLIAILQTIFAIDPEVNLMIQSKEEADGGDIRVHVLTLRNKQVILGAMKRVKISSDFRSNVSLGATAEKIKLTPEQEQIALKTALISRLPWVGVDIMPLVKGSNKEIGDNVVLEINASPGTQGISDVLGENFINILLNELDDPSEFLLQDKIAGYKESVFIDFGRGEKEVLALLDSGNGSNASHIEVGKIKEVDNMIEFDLDGKNYKFEIIGTSKPKVGINELERKIIKIPKLRLGYRTVKNIPMAIIEKRDKSTNMLLNRDIISKLGYVVNSGKTHILSEEIEKINII